MMSIGMVADAQSVTYNHDSSKQNQITVMEVGEGSLTPSLYYTLLHKSYGKSAANKNKLSFRTSASIAGYQQVEYADSIESYLTARAEIEALNVADRQIDLAWQTEGDKITSIMQRFQNNINRIVPCGGSVDDRQRWEQYYNVFNTAITAIRDAVMPNAQRKREYLSIYADVSKQNQTLVKCLTMYSSQSDVEDLLGSNATVVKASLSTAVSDAKSKWHAAALSACGKD